MPAVLAVGSACCAGLLLSATKLFGFPSSGLAPAGTEDGALAVWIFANISFAGMHAQHQGHPLWKLATFILGLPGTLLTLVVVRRGSERAYGVDLPRKAQPR